MIQLGWETKGGGPVASPVDGSSDEWHWNLAARMAPRLADAGFSAVLAPPPWRGANLGNGYDVFNHYDLGRPDIGPTRYGSAEDLAAFAATCDACGLDLYLDAVMAHLNGDDGGRRFRYPGADKRVKNGRWPKDPTCFSDGPEGVRRDPVALPSQRIDFGREPSYRHGYFGDGEGADAAGRYMVEGSTAALLWTQRRLNTKGWRWDATKALDPTMVAHWMEATGGFGVGEYYDGNLDLLLPWLANAGWLSSSFDFRLYFQLREMCNGAGRYDMRRLVNAGLCDAAPFHATTFAENHDTDTDGNPIIWNKRAAYAVIFAEPGYPCVYGKDYLVGPGFYGRGLQAAINNGIWVHEVLAGGPKRYRHADYQRLVFERLGAEVGRPGLLFGINNEPGDGGRPGDWRKVNVPTAFGGGARLHDYAGHADRVRTDGRGNADLWLPPNDNGAGYVFYAPDGHQGTRIERKSRATKQVYEGADDLDIGPAVTGERRTVCRVPALVGSTFRASLDMNRTGWSEGSRAFLEITGPDGEMVLTQERSRGGSDRSTAAGRVRVTGRHTATVVGSALPSGGSPFELTLSFTAPRTPEAA